MSSQEWKDAECARPHIRRSVDMFDESNEGIWYAKAVCEACPLTVKCLNKALDTRERWGVWGGLSTDERERLRKERR